MGGPSARGHLFCLQLEEPVEARRIEVAESFEVQKEEEPSILFGGLTLLSIPVEDPPVS
jgi:hypothetical protein